MQWFNLGTIIYEDDGDVDDDDDDGDGDDDDGDNGEDGDECEHCVGNGLWRADKDDLPNLFTHCDPVYCLSS